MNDTYIITKKEFLPAAERLKKTILAWEGVDIPDNVIHDYLWEKWVSVLVGCYVDDLEIDPRSMKYRAMKKDLVKESE